jgi:hypothetical protein
MANRKKLVPKAGDELDKLKYEVAEKLHLEMVRFAEEEMDKRNGKI